MKGHSLTIRNKLNNKQINANGIVAVLLGNKRDGLLI